MLRYIILVLLLSAFWLLLSGHFTPLFFAFGAACVALVTWVSVRMDKVDKEIDPVHFSPQLLLYWLWLGKETLLANADMVKRLYRRNMNINPGVKTVKANQKTRMAKVIYANSITLTPGTVTLDIDDEKGELELHAIDKALLDEQENGEMEKRVQNLNT